MNLIRRSRSHSRPPTDSTSISRFSPASMVVHRIVTPDDMDLHPRAYYSSRRYHSVASNSHLPNHCFPAEMPPLSSLSSSSPILDTFRLSHTPRPRVSAWLLSRLAQPPAGIDDLEVWSALPQGLEGTKYLKRTSHAGSRPRWKSRNILR